MTEKKERKETHVDEFVRNSFIDAAKAPGATYARWFLFLRRLPAVMQAEFSEWIDPYKLFCTYQDKRYRVTGASRLGDIWLAKDHNRDCGYDHRVALDDCSEWSEKA